MHPPAKDLLAHPDHKPMRHKHIAVTRLASYAADPVRFCHARGQAFSSDGSLQRGERMHARAGRTPMPTGVVLALLALLALAALAWNRGWIP